MKKAALSVSYQATFQEAVCADCLNDIEEKEIFCNILGMLAMNGEHDCIYMMDELQDTGCFVKCMMRRTQEDISIQGIMRWINEQRTEDVEEVLVGIEESYHFDVLRGVT